MAKAVEHDITHVVSKRKGKNRDDEEVTARTVSYTAFVCDSDATSEDERIPKKISGRVPFNDSNTIIEAAIIADVKKRCGI